METIIGDYTLVNQHDLLAAVREGSSAMKDAMRGQLRDVEVEYISSTLALASADPCKIIGSFTSGPHEIEDSYGAKFLKLISTKQKWASDSKDSAFQYWITNCLCVAFAICQQVRLHK
jgi:hypothetical protein